MADYAPLNLPANGKLGHNITHFARAVPQAEKRAAEALLDGVTRDKPTDAVWEGTRDAVANAEGQDCVQVRAFTFGTRLARITRHWRTRDMDAAMNAAGVQAQDRSGGTRIGECLAAFNKDRSWRVPGHAAVVL